jgi:hypothetical protein
MKWRMALRAGAAGALLLLAVTASGWASSPECTSRVFVYLDRSGSLSPEQEEEVTTNFTKFLTGERRDGLLATKVLVTLIPFAGKLGTPVEVSEEEDLAAAIASLWTQNLQIDRRNSDIVEVLKNINERAGQDELRGPQTIFVIASDFKHDPEDRAASDSLIEAWEESWVRKFPERRDLEVKLNALDSPVLLLLPLTGGENPELSDHVLKHVESLTRYQSRLDAILRYRSPSTSILDHFKPFSVVPTVREAGSSGKLELSVVIRNHSCGDFGPLKAVLYRLPNKARLEERSLSSESLEWRLRFEVDRLDPGERKVNENDFKIEVLSGQAGQGDSAKSLVHSRSFNVDEFIFLASFEGKSKDDPDRMEATVRLDLELLDQAEYDIDVFVRAEDQPVATGVLKVRGGDDGMRGRLIEEMELKVEPSFWSTLRLRNDGEENADLELELQAKNGSGSLASSILIQRRLPLFVHRDDAQAALFENLVQQASIPALLTFVGLLGLILWRRRITLGGVDAIAATLGVIGFSAFMVLIYFSPDFRGWVSSGLAEPWSRRIGAAILLMIGILLGTLLIKGGFGGGVDAAESLLGLEKRIHLGRPLGIGSRAWKWRWFFAAFFVLAGIGVGVWVLEQESHECVIEATDELASDRLPRRAPGR